MYYIYSTAFNRCSFIERHLDNYAFILLLWMLFRWGPMFQISEGPTKHIYSKVPECESFQLYQWPWTTNSPEPVWGYLKAHLTGVGGLQQHPQRTSWQGLQSWIQPPPTLSHWLQLAASSGTVFCLCSSHCIKCSWMHDCARGMEARQPYRSCLLGTQYLSFRLLQ